ncbi:MAG: hypothetical protein MZV63_41280 [Marinilabiliales bacterium]|nr:hypothetical protein [Marinilabiliales bacterium]
MRAKVPIIGLAVLLAAFVACDREDEERKEELAVPYAQAAKAPTWTETLAGLSARPGPPQLDRRGRLGVSAPDLARDRDHRDRRGPFRRPGEGPRGRRRGQAHPAEDLARQGAGLRPRETWRPERTRPAGGSTKLLKGRGAAPVLHADLIARLDEVGRAFKIVMVKTTLAVPYTSVFLELDCGYWPSENEAKMREKMK